ncbi:CPBP family intramembrane glutamic endopeptidase [Pseudalkalibacillus hwajinpoensis]|uniref:CPBP family intramembrane metalloprotease n=1 Tax=Guptibacillus hwajinpoensis TaxID=208199 RepID=A0A4V5Q302_9BACL|nr:type II CAAX endopeptidase family protein [Pseudalkalibacillus hwajinpoensis]TKD69768.1 CPBP family intramembrane metalloprotease [Pseudalkalibacillus hwajinpoensis]
MSFCKIHSGGIKIEQKLHDKNQFMWKSFFVVSLLLLIGSVIFSIVFSIRSPLFKYNNLSGPLWVIYSMIVILSISDIRTFLIGELKLKDIKKIYWVIPSLFIMYTLYFITFKWGIFISDSLLRRVNYDIWLLDKNTTYTLLFSCLIVPVAEEILFRGFLTGYLSKKITPWIAIIFSSSVFGYVHFDNQFFQFLIGLILSIIYNKTNSLIPCIVAHSLWNILAYFVIMN